MNKQLTRASKMLAALRKSPSLFLRALNCVSPIIEGYHYAQSFKEHRAVPEPAEPSPDNPLWRHFQNHTEGLGLWKWEHYFEIYHRHFARFVGQPANLLEIGIFSGGSLEMWRTYLGAQCHIYGVDIEAACKAYENDHTHIFIGDQEDRTFWADFKRKVDGIDILIDDGGHYARQQQVTLEEMLPALRPGGVFLCEDIGGPFHHFCAFATGLVHELNSSRSSPFQSMYSIHFYPYVLLIEKRLAPLPRLQAPRHGTVWQPFYAAEHLSPPPEPPSSSPRGAQKSPS